MIFEEILVFSLKLEHFVLKLLPNLTFVRSVYVILFLDFGTRIAKTTGYSDIFLFIWANSYK